MKNQKGFATFSLHERGFAHILGLLLLVAGLGASVYLVGQKTNLFPRAASAPIGCQSDSNCPSGYKCQIQATTLRECPSGVSAPACNTMVGKCVLIQAAKPIPSTKPSEGGSRVFVTSTTYNGNLGGLSGADAKCQERANAVGLGGTWKAWLSDSRTSAASRLIHNNGPYKLVNGMVIANNWDDLIDGTIQNNINITEQGTANNDRGVWTHTKIDGSSMNRNSCSNWTNGTAPETGDGGNTTFRNYPVTWTTSYGAICDVNTFSLYCFEQDSAGSAPTAVVSCSACSADLNKDGQVNIADFGKLVGCMNKKSTDSGWSSCQVADLNGDGQVNINDFSCIREQYGKKCQLGYGGPYNIRMSDNPTTIICKIGQTDCFFSTIIATNKLGKSLYKTTIYNSSSSNIQFQGLDGRWNEPGSKSQSDRVIQSGGGFSVLVKLKPFSKTGTYNDVLYIDAQTCNLNTTPPDCVFYGATQIPFKITVN